MFAIPLFLIPFDFEEMVIHYTLVYVSGRTHECANHCPMPDTLFARLVVVDAKNDKCERLLPFSFLYDIIPVFFTKFTCCVL